MRLPILSAREGGHTLWSPSSFRALGKDEAHLERLIGKAPQLLGLEDLRTQVKGPYAAFHQLRVETASKQRVAPDIVFLSGSGHVVVVEVKLGGNPELGGRKVVAQLVEYAASIATYEEDELAELFDRELPTGARFSDVVRKHLPCEDPIALGKELVRKIQAAELHLVIACDEAPEGLRELVASVTAQEALGSYELRVAELVPYVVQGAGAADVMVVPSAVTRTEIVGRTMVEVRGEVGGQPVQVTVKVTPQSEIERGPRSGRPALPQLLAAIQAYEQIAEGDLRATGWASNFRKIYVPGWASDVHYEFLLGRAKGEFGAELHFESERVRAASNAVRDAHLAASAALPNLSWDQGWTAGNGRLRVLFAPDAPPEALAAAMVELIRRTRGIVDQALGLTPP